MWKLTVLGNFKIHLSKYSINRKLHGSPRTRHPHGWWVRATTRATEIPHHFGRIWCFQVELSLGAGVRAAKEPE